MFAWNMENQFSSLILQTTSNVQIILLKWILV